MLPFSLGTSCNPQINAVQFCKLFFMENLAFLEIIFKNNGEMRQNWYPGSGKIGGQFWFIWNCLKLEKIKLRFWSIFVESRGYGGGKNISGLLIRLWIIKICVFFSEIFKISIFWRKLQVFFDLNVKKKFRGRFSHYSRGINQSKLHKYQ